MKYRAIYGWILGLTAVAVFLGTTAEQGRVSSSKNEAVAFVTIGLDQSKMPTEISSYEVLRATEHFSDIVLGWTAEPSFAKDFSQAVGEDYSFSARRQEKSNLLFTISGPVESEGVALTMVSLIEERLSEYNAATGAGYVVALDREMLVSSTESNWRFSVGLTLLVFIVEGLVLCGYEYTRRR
jgi:hypothetical protein